MCLRRLLELAGVLGLGVWAGLAEPAVGRIGFLGCCHFVELFVGLVEGFGFALV